MMEDTKNAGAAPEAAKQVTENPDDSKPAGMPAAKPAQEPDHDKASEVLASIDEDQAAAEHNNAVEISGADAATGNDGRPNPDPAPSREPEFDQPKPEETAAAEAQADKPEVRAQDRETVTVACGVIGGYTIRRYVPGPDDGTGKNPLVGGQAVILPGPSAVEAGINNMRALDPVRSTQDKEFMLGWLKENARNPMVVSGQISIIEENPKRA